MSLQVDGALDIETEAWDRFAVGGIYFAGEFFHTWDADELYDYLVALSQSSKRVTIWSWNGGRFDFLWVCQVARERGHRWEISTAGSRVTSMRMGKLELRDACALVAQFSLRSAYELAGIDGDQSKDTGLPCVCDDDCGGYCSIKARGMKRAHKARLIAYLERDCRGVVSILDSVLLEFDRSEYEVRGTVGASAWATAKKLCGLNSAEWPDTNVYEMVREGYYGGRCEVFRTQAASGYRYDLRSAYPAALARVSVPIGEPCIFAGPVATRCYGRGDEGVFQARVFVPDMLIPPLPVRLGERVVYPIGKLAGSWTGLELRAAEAAGARVEKIDLGIVYPDSAPVLKVFVEHVYSRRATFAESSAWRKLHKIVANSVTGKLAENPDRTAVILNATSDEIVACPADWECGMVKRHAPRFRCCEHACTRECGSWRALDPSGDLWGAPFWRLGSSAHVQWAAYLTAATRVALREQACVDESSAVYGDTDSCYATKPRPHDRSDTLGTWKAEGRMRLWTALAPKMYRYQDEDGEWVVKAKGIPGMTETMMRDFEAGKTIVYERGVRGLKQAAADGGSLFRRQHLKRTRKAVSGMVGGREKDGAYSTRPLDLATLRERLA